MAQIDLTDGGAARRRDAEEQARAEALVGGPGGSAARRPLSGLAPRRLSGAPLVSRLRRDVRAEGPAGEDGGTAAGDGERAGPVADPAAPVLRSVPGQPDRAAPVDRGSTPAARPAAPPITRADAARPPQAARAPQAAQPQVGQPPQARSGQVTAVRPGAPGQRVPPGSVRPSVQPGAGQVVRGVTRYPPGHPMAGRPQQGAVVQGRSTSYPGQVHPSQAHPAQGGQVARPATGPTRPTSVAPVRPGTATPARRPDAGAPSGGTAMPAAAQAALAQAAAARAATAQRSPVPEAADDALPRYLQLVRKEARVRQDQADWLATEVRRINSSRRRRGGVVGERITDNSLIRVALDLLRAQGDALGGTTEDELVISVVPPLEVALDPDQP